MRRAVILLLLIATATPVFAGNYYTQLMVGLADQETDFSGFKLTGDDISYGVRVGYRLNEIAAFDISYQNFGVARDTFLDASSNKITESFETKSVNIGVNGIFPIENGFSINTRLGLAMWTYTLDETDSSKPGQVIRFEDDGYDVYYGMGAQYAIGRHVYIGMEYTIVDIGLSLTGGLSPDHQVSNTAMFIGVKF